MSFAACSILGYAFVPRIRDLPSKRLHVFERAGIPFPEPSSDIVAIVGTDVPRRSTPPPRNSSRCRTPRPPRPLSPRGKSSRRSLRRVRPTKVQPGPNRQHRTRRCSRYSTAARIWPASHVVQSSLSGSPGTPVARPTATSLTTRCCEPWSSHRARNRCVRATEGSSLTHEHRNPEMGDPGRRRMWLPAQALHVHAALQARAAGHNQPRRRDRSFDRAGLADTHQLARLDAPLHLAENHHRLRRQLRLDPAGRTDRQDMLRQLDRPVDLAVDDEVLAPLTSPSMTTPCPIVVMPSGACGPPARGPRGAGGRPTEASSASCVSTIVK